MSFNLHKLCRELFRHREQQPVGRQFRENLESVPTTQVVKLTWAFAELFFCLAPILERGVNHRPLSFAQLVPCASGRWLPHVLVYRTQNVLNGDRNAWGVAGSLDVDGLGISLVALKR